MGVDISINYAAATKVLGDAPTTLELTIVPEPAGAALALVAMVGALVLFRHRD